jgi:hypothetical protein
MVIVKHMLGLLSAAAIVAGTMSPAAVFAQTPAPQVETPAVGQTEPSPVTDAAPVAVVRAEGEAIGDFLSRIQAGITGGTIEEEAMAEQVALLLPPETTVNDAARSVVDSVLAFAQANSTSAEAVGDGLALAANAASNANNAALARMIRVRVEGVAGLLAQAFSDNFTATAAGGGAGGAGAGAGGGGAIGGTAGAVGGGTGGLGEGSSPVAQTNTTTAPSGGSTSTADFATGNATSSDDVSPG